MKVFLVAGARPNFMKIAPIFRASLAYLDVDCQIVHTGQHYDYAMSESFFADLDIPAPAFNLEAGSGSHAVQTARIMVGFEELCLQQRPDLVMVVGDVNSTLACSIVAKKLQIEVAHVEAGLRSFDLDMPEEINRMVTDAISDYLFVTEESAVQNLLQEGKAADKVHMVGHVMIDNLLHQVDRLIKGGKSPFKTSKFKNQHEKYGFFTLHRPSNVDCKTTFERIASAVNEISKQLPIIFPVHPRTRSMIEKHKIKFSDSVTILPPLGFNEALHLWMDADAVLTDSGGLQEETTALGVPCVTIRDNTERPITVEVGTNVLAGTSYDRILSAFRESTAKRGRTSIPAMWDGKAAERIWAVVVGDGVQVNQKISNFG